MASNLSLLILMTLSSLSVCPARVAVAGPGGYVEHGVTYTSGFSYTDATIQSNSQERGQQQWSATTEHTAHSGTVGYTDSDHHAPQQTIHFNNVAQHQSHSREFGQEAFGSESQAEGTVRAETGFFETNHHTGAGVR